MENNNISVIIPLYNAEKYIVKALESCFSQKLVGEVIVVDDGSSDLSVKLVDDMARYNSKIQLIRSASKENVGAAQSRNIGIERASNSWIAFLDADDFYLPHRFDRFESILKENPEMDGVYEAVENVFESEEEKSKYLKSRPEHLQGGELKAKLNLFTLYREVSPDQLPFDLISGNNGFFHFNGLVVKKSLIEDVGYLNQKLRITQDTDFFIKLSIRGKLIAGNLDKPVAARLVHPENRIYRNEERRIYFAFILFTDLKSWALKQEVRVEIQKAIQKKIIWMVGSLILKWNMYRWTRVKGAFLWMTNRFILNHYFRTNKNKFQK